MWPPTTQTGRKHIPDGWRSTKRKKVGVMKPEYSIRKNFKELMDNLRENPPPVECLWFIIIVMLLFLFSN